MDNDKEIGDAPGGSREFAPNEDACRIGEKPVGQLQCHFTAACVSASMTR